MNLLINNQSYVLINPETFDLRHLKIRTRNLIEDKIASILIDSYYSPSNKAANGAFFIDNLHFAANMKILGLKLGIHSNSLNKDFRHHNIKCVQKLETNKLTNILDGKGWKIYQHSNQVFSLSNILKGNIQITSKWNKNAKKHSLEKVKEEGKNEIPKMEKNINENKFIKNEKTTNYLISKEDLYNEEFISGEEDSYMEYLD